MKGINAKRIAALAACAVVLGTSAIAANVMYGSTELVSDNGQPTVKIVVGSQAQVSDGVAAANIASAIAHQAYKTAVFKADTPAKPTCTVGAGSGSGTGTCEVTDKKVTLEIEIPGVLGNAYQFKTLITDTLDKTLANRMNTLSEDNYTANKSQSDTSTILSPLRGVAENTATSVNLFRIGANEFNGFQPQTVKDDQAGSDFAYKEEQAFWVGTGAPASGVYYDTNSNYRQVVARPNSIAYNMRFLGNDFGIPVCTANLATSGVWTSCTSDTDRSDNHRIKVQFLGDTWVISKMTQPSNSTAAGQLANTNGVQNGGTVKLAKEAKYDIINVGGVIDGGTFKIRLADISVATGATNLHPAIIDILDANDAVVGQIQVNPGETYTYTQSSTGSQIKVHVYRTAPGFTLNAKWAEIAVYTDEITLEDGKRYDNAASDDVNWKNVKVSLLWKNRDGSTTDNQPDALREIVLYVDDLSSYLGGEDRMVKGTSMSFPKKNAAYRTTYNGLDLTDADYISVKFRSDSGRTLAVSNSADCNTKNNSYTGTFIKVTSGTSNAFGGTSDALNNDRTDELYVDPIGNYTAGSDLTQSTADSTWVPQIFWKPTGCSYYKTATMSAGTALGTAEQTSSVFSTTGKAVKLEAAGADSSAPGFLYFAFNVSNGTLFDTINNGYGGTANISNAVGEILLQEDAGKHDAQSHYPVMLRFPVLNISSSQWRFKAQDSTTSVVYYNGIATTDTSTTVTLPNATSYELAFYTERGSKATGVSLTDASMMVATKIGQPTFTFAPASSEIGSTGTEEVMKEGDVKTLSNGVKIKVKKISETVGSCVASASGGTPSCTVSDVAAPTIDGKATLEASVPYPNMPSLVALDKDGPTAAVLVSVGGPVVNTVTAGALKDSPVDFKTESVVVKEMGNTIVVAGYTAADTMQAADEFIAGIKRK